MCALRNFSSIFKQLVIVGSVILSLGSGLAQGQGVLKSAENVLQRIQQLLQNQELFLQDQGQLVESYQYKLDRAKKDQLQAEQDLLKKKSKALESSQQHKSSPSSSTQRQLNQDQHGWKMAQRAVRNRTKRLQRIETKLAKAEQELQAAKAKLTDLKQQEQRQSAYLVNLRRNQAAERARLAKQAETKQQEAPVAVIAKAEPAQAKVVEQSLEAEVQQQLLAVESQSAEAKAAAQLEAPVNSVDLSSLDQEAVAQAKREEERLQRLLEKRKSTRPIFKNLQLRSSRMKPAKFTHMGNNMYRVEAKVAAGKQLFEVANTDVRIQIPDADDGELYVFIYDARRASRGRLSMYKKSLLGP